MSDFIFPFNGRLAIIDDLEKEVRPLRSIFNKKGIPFNYYNPADSFDELPDDDSGNENPPRFVFLDLNLQVGVSDVRTVVGYTMAILERIVNANTPYVLILWSMRIADFADALIEELKINTGITPIASIKLIKSNYINIAEGVFVEGDKSLKKLSDDIKAQLDDSASTQLLLEWEQFIHNSSNQVIELTSNLSDNSEDNSQAILFQMAQSHDTHNSGNAEIAKSACYVLNNVFEDVVENNINELRFKNDIKSGMVSCEAISKINSSLLCSFEFKKDYPGSVFEFNLNALNNYHNYFKKGSEWINSLIDFDKIRSVIRKPKLLERGGKKATKEIKAEVEVEVEVEIAKIKLNIEGIEVIVTPACDFSQDKRVMTRVVYGIILKYFPESIRLEKGIVKDTDYTINIPTVDINSTPSKLILDSRFFTSKPKKKFKTKFFLCKFRHQMLVDIQTKIASHVSRLGVNNFG